MPYIRQNGPEETGVAFLKPNKFVIFNPFTRHNIKWPIFD